MTLSSVLLHFQDAQSANVAIEFGLDLATKCRARVRGLTLIDTRRLSSLATGAEAAVYCKTEFRRLSRIDQEQSTIRSLLSKACLEAEVNFDIRHGKGDPVEIIPFESQFHDLVITAFPTLGSSAMDNPGLTAAEVVSMLARGAQPFCVLRNSARNIRRVLLVSDGTPASARAVRHFVELSPFPDADHRVLAMGRSETRAKELLREMVECVRGRLPKFESGWLVGAARRTLLPYAQKWHADLVVTGVTKPSPMLRPLLLEPAELILRRTDMGLYVTA